MNERECRHDNSQQSTLNTWYVSPITDVTKNAYWFVECDVCGRATEYCLTQHEAIRRGCAEWWAR